MHFDNFTPTSNFISRREQDARRISTRRAFFMPESQVVDSTDTSAACLRWYLSYPHFNFSPCDELLVGGEEGSRFFCSQLTSNSIMSKSTIELITVQVTPAQKSLLEFVMPLDAKDIAQNLGTVCITAINAELLDTDAIVRTMYLMQHVYEIALEYHHQKNQLSND